MCSATDAEVRDEDGAALAISDALTRQVEKPVPLWLKEAPMDAKVFDALTRLVTTASSRRIAVAFALSGTLGALNHADVDARKRKRRKRCRRQKKKCGKRCIPKSRCCPDADCGGGGVCQGGTCACLSGFKPCRGTCILVGLCCTTSDCGEGTTCDAGTCQCLSGYTKCGPNCCPAGATCLGNFSCATTCTDSSDCDFPACLCSVASVEGPKRCVQSGLSCGQVPLVCTSTAQCPTGQHCNMTGCSGSPNPNRCIPLCAP